MLRRINIVILTYFQPILSMIVTDICKKKKKTSHTQFSYIRCTTQQLLKNVMSGASTDNKLWWNMLSSLTCNSRHLVVLRRSLLIMEFFICCLQSLINTNTSHYTVWDNLGQVGSLYFPPVQGFKTLTCVEVYTSHLSKVLKPWPVWNFILPTCPRLIFSIKP